MVGETGFEPATLWSQTRCATRLRHSPTCRFHSHGNTERQNKSVMPNKFFIKAEKSVTLKDIWWARRDSNPRPIRYERTALTN
jgi:hypothetical protein